MQKYFLGILCLLLSLMVNTTLAKHDNDDQVIHYKNQLNQCNITKSTFNNYEPKKFSSINNLLRNTGQKPRYNGKQIIIRGILLDRNCKPISDAKIYTWQVDQEGKYPYQPLKTRINKDLINLNSDYTFTGSGTTTTNNKGQFYFITIYPKSINKKPPYVNIRAKHLISGTLQTKLYLLDDNILSPNAEIDITNIDIIQDAIVYNFHIVMPITVSNHY